MPKIKVTAIPRKPVDVGGLLAMLVDLAREQRHEQKEDRSTAAPKTPTKVATNG